MSWIKQTSKTTASFFFFSFFFFSSYQKEGRRKHFWISLLWRILTEHGPTLNRKKKWAFQEGLWIDKYSHAVEQHLMHTWQRRCNPRGNIYIQTLMQLCTDRTSHSFANCERDGPAFTILFGSIFFVLIEMEIWWNTASHLSIHSPVFCFHSFWFSIHLSLSLVVSYVAPLSPQHACSPFRHTKAAQS